jgi:hypothetical protein
MAVQGRLFAAEGDREANFFAGGPLSYRPIHLTIIRHV